jgi:hypothetical protein
MKITKIVVPDGELIIEKGATFEEAKLILKQYIRSQLNKVTLDSLDKDSGYISREIKRYLPFAKYLQ